LALGLTFGPPPPPLGICTTAGIVIDGKATRRVMARVAALPESALPPSRRLTRTIGGMELVLTHSSSHCIAFVSQHSTTKSFTLRASTSG